MVVSASSIAGISLTFNCLDGTDTDKALALFDCDRAHAAVAVGILVRPFVNTSVRQLGRPITISSALRILNRNFYTNSAWSGSARRGALFCQHYLLSDQRRSGRTNGRVRARVSSARCARRWRTRNRTVPWAPAVGAHQRSGQRLEHEMSLNSIFMQIAAQTHAPAKQR